MRSTTLASIAAAGIVTLIALPASATLQTYNGTNLNYQWDDAQAATALYGQPQFSGDDAYFTPGVFPQPPFRAQSSDGVGIHSGTNTDSIDSTFVFSRIWTTDTNNEILNILAYEEGDYEINYAGGTVSGNLYLRALGLNAVEPTIIGTDAVGFSGVAGGTGNQLWSMSTNVSPDAALAQIANNITLTIQNQLYAFSTDATSGSEYAYIEKKLFLQINTLIPTGTTVPVPAAAWLFGSAFGVLSLARRRRVA